MNFKRIIMKKNDKNRAAEVKARFDKIRQRMRDAELNGDTDYFTKKNEHGETQADIDAMLLAIEKCYDENGKLIGKMSN